MKDVLTESQGSWEPGSNNSLNGPRRAWSKDFYLILVFHDVRHTLIAKDMFVS